MQDTSQLLSLKETELKELNQKMEDEVRRLNGNYLRMRGEVKDAVKALEDEKLGRADDNEAAGLREKELLALIEVMPPDRFCVMLPLLEPCSFAFCAMRLAAGPALLCCREHRGRSRRPSRRSA